MCSVSCTCTTRPPPSTFSTICPGIFLCRNSRIRRRASSGRPLIIVVPAELEARAAPRDGAQRPPEVHAPLLRIVVRPHRGSREELRHVVLVEGGGGVEEERGAAGDEGAAEGRAPARRVGAVEVRGDDPLAGGGDRGHLRPVVGEGAPMVVIV